MALFGMLILEREPFAFRHFAGLLQAWLQDAGGFAALGLIAYIFYALRIPAEQASSARTRAGINGWMLVMALCALVCYGIYGSLVNSGKGADRLNVQNPAAAKGQFVKYEPPKFSKDLQPATLMLGGAFSLLGILQPFFMSLMKLSRRRIFALVKLCLLEVLRNKLLWVFVLFLIPILFPINWFYKSKPEDELRMIIEVESFLTQVLVLLTAGLIGSFSIPNDIKNQNIYTIVTKPVERFEIVLGRFFGYLVVLTGALLFMTFVAWTFVRATGVDPRAAEETLKARVPLRGNLDFRSTRLGFTGSNVGREFDYRRYIAGDPNSTQRAVWSFYKLPSSLKSGRDFVQCEFTFDIYRMTKGEENKGVDLNIRVCTWKSPQKAPEQKGVDWNWEKADDKKNYEEAAKQKIAKARGIKADDIQNPSAELSAARPGDKEWEILNELAAEFGYFEVSSKEVFDYHTDNIKIPVGLFENAMSGEPKEIESKFGGPPRKPPLVEIYVKCTTKSQMLGVAEADLFILESERTFDENFFRESFGLWCRVALVLGLAVCVSTYLAGVISFLTVVFLFLSGYIIDHIVDIGSGKSYTGGPFVSMNQLLRAESSNATPDTSTPITNAAQNLDFLFSWVIRRFVNLVPDVYAYNWTDYLSEGYNIPLECLVMNLVTTIGYLLPWFVLSYYLMRSREVAA